MDDFRLRVKMMINYILKLFEVNLYSHIKYQSKLEI